MEFDIRGEVPQLRDAIADGEGQSGVFQIEGHFARRMLEAHDTLEAQLF